MLKIVPLVFSLCLLTACSPGADAAGGQAESDPADAAAPSLNAAGAEVETETEAVEEAATAVAGEQPAADAIDIAAAPLDLSLPDIGHFELNQNPGDFRPRKFDPDSLFNKPKEDPVSFSVKPNLVFGEKLLSVPQIDGGSVSVEVKTK